MPAGNLRARHLVPTTLLTGAGAAPLQTLTCLFIALANNAAAVAVDLTVDKKFTVLDATAIKGLIAGAAGDEVQLQTAAGAANITDSMDIGTPAAANVVLRAASIFTANATIAAGGTLRIKRLFNTNNGVSVLVTGIYTA